MVVLRPGEFAIYDFARPYELAYDSAVQLAAFFTGLGFEFFGMTDDMASVIISEHTQVMLLAEPTFATYATKSVADATASTEAILVLGLERTDQVDALVDKALAAGASLRESRSTAAAGISAVSPISTATTGRRCAWWSRPADPGARGPILNRNRQHSSPNCWNSSLPGLPRTSATAPIIPG